MESRSPRAMRLRLQELFACFSRAARRSAAEGLEQPPGDDGGQFTEADHHRVEHDERDRNQEGVGPVRFRTGHDPHVLGHMADGAGGGGVREDRARPWRPRRPRRAPGVPPATARSATGPARSWQAVRRTPGARVLLASAGTVPEPPRPTARPVSDRSAPPRAPAPSAPRVGRTSTGCRPPSASTGATGVCTAVPRSSGAQKPCHRFISASAHRQRTPLARGRSCPPAGEGSGPSRRAMLLT